MRYRAFISYASADRAIGERFQRGVERYRIPRVLRGRDYGLGPLPKYVAPLFRDRSDADAAVSLAAALHAALEHSEALVVLCSPVSAQSRWVNDEIRAFKALGREARIFPVIVDGEPRRYHAADAPNGAFPPALFQRVDAVGAVVSEDAPEPLASDLRPSGDGFLLARLKIVAALTGVSLTELAQRQHEAERRERVLVRSVAAVMAVLAIVATAAAVQAWRSAERARARLESAIEMASRRVDDAARFQDAYGVPIEVTRQLLAGAERDFSTLIGQGDTGVPTLDLQRGRLLVLFSNLYGVVGNGDRQRTRAREAVASLEAVPTRRRLLAPWTWLVRLPTPAALIEERLGAIEALGKALARDEGAGDEAARQFEAGRTLAERTGQRKYLARFWALAGEHRYAGGDIAGALAAQQEAIRVLDALVAGGGGSDAVVERALARSDKAEMLLEAERHQEALDEQASAVAALEAQAAAQTGDTAAQRHLGQALVRAGDMRYAVTGDWTESLPLYERALAVLERTHASDRARVDYARDLSIALERLGDAMFQRGSVERARGLFTRLVELRQDLLARDTSNDESRRDLAVALERQGDLALADRDPARALASFDEARALRTGSQQPGDGRNDQRIVTRDLAVLWSKTGAARRAMGRREQWGAAYETAIALMAPLVAQRDAPPGWRRDLAVFRTAYADALSRDGRWHDALAQWTAALTLTESQLVISPDDPRLRADQSLLRARIARARSGGRAVAGRIVGESRRQDSIRPVPLTPGLVHRADRASRVPKAVRTRRGAAHPL